MPTINQQLAEALGVLLSLNQSPVATNEQYEEAEAVAAGALLDYEVNHRGVTHWGFTTYNGDTYAFESAEDAMSALQIAVDRREGVEEVHLWYDLPEHRQVWTVAQFYGRED